MKKSFVFPALSLLMLFLVNACGVSTAEHVKVASDLADCAKQRDETTVQSNICGNQVKNLTAETEALKKDKESLQSTVSELTSKAEKAEQLEKATQTYQDLQKKLEREIQDGQIQLTEMKNRLTMTLVDKILFASGSADVSKEGKKVLDKVITILKDIKDKRIQVEGHTDNVRIYSAIKTKYPTNWELSTARATQAVSAGGGRHRSEAALGYRLFRVSARCFERYG